MKHTTLGHTGIRVSAVGLGCSRIGSATNASSVEEQKLFLRRAYLDGVNHFDTANIYGQGDSERLIGIVFRGCRHMVVIATKAGQKYSEGQKLAIRLRRPLRYLAARSRWLTNQIQRARSVSLNREFEPGYLSRELAQSCQRLSTDYVDIFYLHSPTAADLSSKDLPKLMASLKARGLIRAWGISCDGDVDVEALLSRVTPDVLQLSHQATSHDRNKLALETFVKEGGSVIAREILANTNLSTLTASDLDVDRAWAAACAPTHVSAVLCGTGNIDHLRVALRSVEGRAAARGT